MEGHARDTASDALPLLQKAAHFSFAGIAAEQDLPAMRVQLEDVAGWLKRHGVSAECHAEASAGGSDEMPPQPLDAAIIFATLGDLVPMALRAVHKGGRVVCAGIHMCPADRTGRPMTPAMTPASLLLRAAVLGLCAASLAACGVAAPPPSVYVLGQPPSVPSGIRSDVGRPIVELVRVAVPGYLDTPDLLVRRSANQLAPSLTGRWGERLSVGVTRALAQALSARLPGMAVVSLPPAGTPALRLLVDVEAFEARPNGTCIMVARWSATGRAGRTLAAERISLVEPVAQGAGEPSGDAAVASAMTRAVDALADRIAAGGAARGSSIATAHYGLILPFLEPNARRFDNLTIGRAAMGT